MEVSVLNMQGEKIRSVDLPASIFEVLPNIDLMHQAYVRQMANARLGTHKTKGRSEVSGGGRKPWKQKGTGRARQGSIRSAQWVGGGKIHTPKPRDYTLDMPRKMRREALRSALSVKAAEDCIVVLDELKFEEPKTRLVAQLLKRLVGNDTALVVVPRKSEAYDVVTRAVSNLPDAKALLASYLNIRDLFNYQKVILPLDAIEVITNHLG
ncbi:MAG: 50S ribosomal protein L4 [Chloroflexota bacterium]|jgi:large subunit ribosomal protein L4